MINLDRWIISVCKRTRTGLAVKPKVESKMVRPCEAETSLESEKKTHGRG